MSNMSNEAVPRFNTTINGNSMPPVPQMPELQATLRIPKNDEIVVPDGVTTEDLRLSPIEVVTKYNGEPKRIMAVLEAKGSDLIKELPRDPDDADVLLANIIDCDSFMRKNIPKPDELIKGVLYQGDKMCLNAGSKIGKTWHLLRLGLSVSEGLPWLGCATSKTKVLFVNFELQDHVIQERIMMIKSDILANCDCSNFSLLNMRNVNMRPEKMMPVLTVLGDRLKNAGYGMVIFDPIYKMYGWDMDENSASDISHLLNAFEEFARKTGASIVYSHHYAKGGQASKESIDRASGSGVFARDPDSIVNITALEDNDENTSYRVDMNLRCFKPVKPFGIRIISGKVTVDSSLKINNIKKPGQYKPQYSEQDILKVLNGKAYTTGQLIKAVKVETGMSESKFYELLKAVKDVEGVVCEDKQWKYTIPLCNPANN